MKKWNVNAEVTHRQCPNKQTGTCRKWYTENTKCGTAWHYDKLKEDEHQGDAWEIQTPEYEKPVKVKADVADESYF